MFKQRTLYRCAPLFSVFPLPVSYGLLVDFTSLLYQAPKSGKCPILYLFFDLHNLFLYEYDAEGYKVSGMSTSISDHHDDGLAGILLKWLKVYALMANPATSKGPRTERSESEASLC